VWKSVAIVPIVPSDKSQLTPEVRLRIAFLAAIFFVPAKNFACDQWKGLYDAH
jgi:hypothetical protein